MKTLKKIIAGTSAIALIAMNAVSFTAYAAAVNDATAVITPTTWVVVSSVTWGFAWTCAASIVMTNNAWANSNITVDLCTVTDGNTLTVAASTIAAAQYYTITFTTSNWVFGSTAAWDTTNNVIVSATVVPTLSMNLSTSTLALWVLNTATYQATSVDVATATNAVWWADVTVTSAWLKDALTNKEIWVTNIAAEAQTAATDYYKLSTNAAPVLTDVNAWLSAVWGTDILASQVILNWTTSTDSTATTKVTVGSKIWATTEAGNYTDTLTFTVAGSF